MQLKEVAKAYKKTEMFGAVETKDPETVVVLVMEELIKSVKSFHKNISLKTGNLLNRSKDFSKAISVIYILQSSLDLEKGGQVAYDLFRLYEFLRLNLITELKNAAINKSLIALNSIVEIKDSWSKLIIEK